MKKSELLAIVESLEGRIVALEETIDFLRADVHQSRNPYAKGKPSLVGSPEWQAYARSIINHIHINR